MIKERKRQKKEFESNLSDFRKFNVEENNEDLKNQLNELPILDKLREFTLTEVSIDFGTTSLYASAMWDEKLIYPPIERGDGFTSEMNYEIAETSVLLHLHKVAQFQKYCVITLQLYYSNH